MGEAFRDDPARVFRACQRTMPPAMRKGLFGPQGVFGPLGKFLQPVLAAAHVAETDGIFEARTRRRSRASFRWVIAVRDGANAATRQPTGMADPQFRSLPALESLFGHDIIDVVACSPDLRAATSRLQGAAAVLGQPQAGWVATSAVRVHATPWEWLCAAGAGVLPLGNERDIQDYLLDCGHGVIGRDIPHAEALLRKMQRQHGIPPVLVAQGGSG